MAKTEQELHHETMQRFIRFANEMKDEGLSKKIIAAGLMTADCIYATYGAVGNRGLLDDAGIDKITNAYRQQLVDLRRIRKENNNARAEQKIKDTAERMVSFPEDE